MGRCDPPRTEMTVSESKQDGAPDRDDQFDDQSSDQSEYRVMTRSQRRRYRRRASALRADPTPPRSLASSDSGLEENPRDSGSEHPSIREDVSSHSGDGQSGFDVSTADDDTKTVSRTNTPEPAADVQEAHEWDADSKHGTEMVPIVRGDSDAVRVELRTMCSAPIYDASVASEATDRKSVV